MSKLMESMAWWEIDCPSNGSIAVSGTAVVSSNFWEFSSYTKEELGDRREKWLSKVWHEDLERVQEAAEYEVWEVDFRFHKKDGSLVWFRESGRWQQIENGKPRKISAIVKNLTIERKSMERIENKEKESARIALEAIDLCPITMALFLVKNSNVKLLEMNEAGLKLWKFNSYQNAAENFMQTAKDNFSVAFDEKINYVIQNGSIEFNAILNIKGESIDLKVSMKKIELTDKVLIIAYMLPDTIAS